MNYLVVNQNRDLLAKANTLHVGMIIAKALSNEENLHDAIFVLFRDEALIVKAYYVDGIEHKAKARITF